MWHKKVIVLGLFLLFLLMLNMMQGCVSTNLLEDEVMFCMVYDYSNRGVSEINIFVDEKLFGTTDSSGRCVLPRLENASLENQKQLHSIRLEKSGYEVLEDKFYFDSMKVMYFKMGSKTQLMELAEQNLDCGKYDKASFFAKKAALCGNDFSCEYLLAISLEKEKRDFNNALLDTISQIWFQNMKRIIYFFNFYTNLF